VRHFLWFFLNFASSIVLRSKTLSMAGIARNGQSANYL